MKISLDPNNLFYLLQENDRSVENLKRILLSFSCSQNFENDEAIRKYININNSKRKSFYSFLAEMLQAIFLKDIYNYNLVDHVISYNFNETLTHSGPDSCLYSEEDKQIVLGEAKFIESCGECFRNIIDDFKRGNGLFEKLRSLSVAAQNNPSAREIIISKLGDTSLKMVALKDFLKNDLLFCGFALHKSINDKNVYLSSSYYDGYKIDVDEIVKHIKELYETEFVQNLDEVGKYKIYIFHLPIHSKKELIFKIIKEAQKRYLDLP